MLTSRLSIILRSIFVLKLSFYKEISFCYLLSFFFSSSLIQVMTLLNLQATPVDQLLLAMSSIVIRTLTPVTRTTVLSLSSFVQGTCISSLSMLLNLRVMGRPNSSNSLLFSPTFSMTISPSSKPTSKLFFSTPLRYLPTCFIRMLSIMLVIIPAQCSSQYIKIAQNLNSIILIVLCNNFKIYAMSEHLYYSRLREDKPKVLRRYVNTNNPSLKSDLMASVLLQPDRPAKIKQYISLVRNPEQTIKQMDQLDIASKDFDNKRMTPSRKNSSEKTRNQAQAKSKLDVNQLLDGYLNDSYVKIMGDRQENPHKFEKRSKSVALMKLYISNDEGVYVKQERPYNIISNEPQQIKELRRFPSLSGEFKTNFMRDSSIQQKQKKLIL